MTIQEEPSVREKTILSLSGDIISLLINMDKRLDDYFCREQPDSGEAKVQAPKQSNILDEIIDRLLEGTERLHALHTYLEKKVLPKIK